MRTSPRRAEHGSLIVYVALALMIFGLLTIAGVSRFGASVRGVLAPNCATAARYMAEAGLRYAAARLRACADKDTLAAAVSDMNGHGLYTLDAGRGLGFSLNITYDANYTATVISTGKGCSIIAPVTATASASDINLPVVANSNAVIDFSNLADDFMRTAALQGTNPISINADAKTISFGTINGAHNAAAIWYAGNATSGCLDGNCTMDNGLRAYFTVQWNPSSVADGLVFGVMSGQTNSLTSVGGDPYMGELMGWAGPGTATGSGNGIRPPKIGLEFDTWYNACGDSPYLAASRCDPTTNANPNQNNSPDHMAYVFWGSNTSSGSQTVRVNNAWVTRSGITYDDNKHGAGSGSTTEPVSSNDPDSNGNGLFGMYYPSSPVGWLRGGTKYYIRYELTRLTTPSAASSSSYCYMLKTWVTSSAPQPAYKSVIADYDAAANPPTLQQVIFLNASYHSQMNKVIFGWTEATGDYTQNITVGDFALAFKRTQPAYGSAPAGYTAYWPMYDNVGSTVSNAAGSALNGSITGTARWVPGIANNNGAALYFNGATIMQTADAAALDLTDTGGVSLWFNMTAANRNKWLLRKGVARTTVSSGWGGTTTTTVDTTEAYGLYIDANGKLRFRLRYGTGAGDIVEAVSTTAPAQGKWCHVAATWNGSTLTLYINGVSEASVSTGHSAQNSADPFCLGANPTITTTTSWWGGSSTSTSYNGFTGIIDEVYLYKALLSQANVTALATGAP